MRSPRRTLAAATVSLEAFVVFFGGLVAKDLSSLSPGAALGIFSGLAVACLVTAGLLGRPWGYALGWMVQAAVVASGFWVPVMFFLGAVFALLWWVALSQGARIERERAAYAREHP
jgi:fatty acid desaturase